MSPIPDFNHNNVLPPHLGNPVHRDDLSPYQCSIIELCNKYSTSAERITILRGLINFRQRMTGLGIIHGFQWLDGSFLENIEVLEGRPPRDLDIVTFFGDLSQDDLDNIRVAFPEFSNKTLSKRNFQLDHYPVDYTFRPDLTVEITRYWIQLFTHSRDSVWKGILRLSLNTDIDDQHAMNYLNSL